MKNFFADAFAEGWRTVETYRSGIEFGVNAEKAAQSDEPVPPDLLPKLHAQVIAMLQKDLPKLRDSLVAVELTGSINTIDCTIRDLARLSLSELKRDLEQVQHGVEKELANRRFMYIPPNRASWFDRAAGFGNDVAHAFPSAEYDIQEAGNCFGAGCYTAVACHLMRALEPALAALARSVNAFLGRPVVEVGENWMRTLQQIDGALKETQNMPNATPGKDAHIATVRRASLQFDNLRALYRNNTMHGRLKYNEGDAAGVVKTVGDFMDRLAKDGLHE